MANDSLVGYPQTGVAGESPVVKNMWVMVDYIYGHSRPEDCRPIVIRHYESSLGTAAIV